MDRFYCYRHIRLDKNEIFYIGLGKVDTRYSPYLIDITADQFHPGEEKHYRYIIEKKPVQGYKKG